MKRSLRHAAVLLLVAAAGSIPAANPASAAVPLLVCTGTETETYSPGLRLAPRTVTVTVDRILSVCVSLTHPRIKSVHHAPTPNKQKSCADLLAPSTGEFTIPWSTGDSSTFRFTRTVTTPGGAAVITRTGVITKGLFAHHTAVMTTTLPVAQPTACLSEPGLTSVGGLATFTVLPL